MEQRLEVIGLCKKHYLRKTKWIDRVVEDARSCFNIHISKQGIWDLMKKFKKNGKQQVYLYSIFVTYLLDLPTIRPWSK